MLELLPPLPSDTAYCFLKMETSSHTIIGRLSFSLYVGSSTEYFGMTDLIFLMLDAAVIEVL